MIFGLLPGLMLGCGKPEELLLPDAPSPQTGRDFDPATAGTITGRVIWDGDIPAVPEFQAVTTNHLSGIMVANPHAPRIDPDGHGMAGVVVSLAGADPARSRPWDHPPVRIVVRDQQLRVVQGDTPGRVGFVQTGSPIEMSSAEPGIQMVRARGAAYFTLPFPDPGQPLERRLNEPGRVVLTNGAGYYWQSADLFVSDHPYWAVTDFQGKFTLPQVPAGEYIITFWTRDWQIVGLDNNPETGLKLRQHYGQPVEQTQPVTVTAGQTSELPEIAFQPADFR